MKSERTIVDAALEVLKSAKSTMSIQEIYQEIVNRSLYVFHAQDPLSVVRVELRKHSVGIDFPTASKKKYFVYDETNGRFRALNKKFEIVSTVNTDKTYLTQVRNLYDSYLKDFKANILVQLKRMNREKGVCEFGIILQNDSCKNRGIGTEAIRLGMEAARDLYGMKTLIGDTMGRNKRMIRVFEKLGFQLTEKIPASFELPDGQKEDRLVYRINLTEDNIK